MRNTTKLLAAAGTVAAGSLMMAAPAFAATAITSPACGSTCPVTSYTSADHNGQPKPWTVTGSGFTAGQQVFEEICDGVAPTTGGYDPGAHCDIGSSGSAAVADSSGNVSFPASSTNLQIHPFLGDSPQGIFACIYPGQGVGNNGYSGAAGTAYTNCQLRLSTNNTAVTSDQVYQTISYVDPASTATAPATTSYGAAAALGGSTVVLAGGLFLARKRRAASAA